MLLLAMAVTYLPAVAGPINPSPSLDADGAAGGMLPTQGVPLNIASAQKGARLGQWLGFTGSSVKLYAKTDVGGGVDVGMWELVPVNKSSGGGTPDGGLFFIENKWHPAPHSCADSRYGDWLSFTGHDVSLSATGDLANKVPWALLPVPGGGPGDFFLQNRWKTKAEPRYGLYAGAAASPKPYTQVVLVPEAQRVAWSSTAPTWKNPAPPCPPPAPAPPPCGGTDQPKCVCPAPAADLPQPPCPAAAPVPTCDPPSCDSARFLGKDTATQGDWRSAKYGTTGCAMFGLGSTGPYTGQLPDFVACLNISTTARDGRWP